MNLKLKDPMGTSWSAPYLDLDYDSIKTEFKTIYHEFNPQSNQRLKSVLVASMLNMQL
jgi:hypothetical protein